jgi:2-oxoglutarate ferredoxin oxidoreductase subunit beta
MIRRSYSHQGASFLEIYQNCNIFNDGAFEIYTEKTSKAGQALFVEHGQPMVFGANKELGIRLNGLKPEVVEIGEGYNLNDLWIHDETDMHKAQILTRMFDNPTDENHLPRPFGVFYAVQRACYDDLVTAQIQDTIDAKGIGDLDALIAGKETWTVL